VYFYRITLKSENEGSRSFVFGAEDMLDAIHIASVFADDMCEEWDDYDVEPLSLDGSIMELCTF
jgi:hypothetical protein